MSARRVQGSAAAEARGGTRPMMRRRAALGSSAPLAMAPAAYDADMLVRYEAVHGREQPAGAERRLLLAVLEDGIRTLLKCAEATRGRALNLRREALSWLTSDGGSDVFAFESICEVLGIDAVRLRDRVLIEATRPRSRRPVH